jgi:hypothetical protein
MWIQRSSTGSSATYATDSPARAPDGSRGEGRIFLKESMVAFLNVIGGLYTITDYFTVFVEFSLFLDN